MKQQSCFILGKKKKNNECKKYNYAIKYHITMASVEPAGMIPNLNCFLAKDKSQSWSVEFSKQEKSNIRN